MIVLAVVAALLIVFVLLTHETLLGALILGVLVVASIPFVLLLLHTDWTALLFGVVVLGVWFTLQDRRDQRRARQKGAR